MTTGEKIRAARQKAGLTQKQLGELCGIAEPTIRRYELDKLNPKLETLLKIANPLGVPYSDLYGDTVAIDATGGFNISFSGGAKKEEVVTMFNDLISAIEEFDGNNLSQGDMAQIFQKFSGKQGWRKYKIIQQPAPEMRHDLPPASPEGTDTTPTAPPPESPENGE